MKQEVNIWRNNKALGEEEMRELAGRISKLLVPGDIVLLNGVVGAGKSFFVREIIYAAGLDREVLVPSPTFTLVNDYEIGDRLWFHLDLYRLESAEELGELGLGDDIGKAIYLVEWGKHFKEALAEPTFALEITVVDAFSRDVHIKAEPSRLKGLGNFG